MNKLKFLPAMLALILLGVGMNEGMAQSTRRAGIKVGLNASNLYVDNVDDENARLGVNLGLYGELISTDAFGLQTELLYSTKGSKNFYGAPFNQEVKYNLNYLDLPVLAIFKLGAVDLQFGGYGSYLLGANISYQGDLANGQDEIDKDNLKSYDYGLVGGVGVNFGNVQVGARYNYGLVKLADSNAARALIGDSKNSVGQLYLAFNLNDQ
jgi:Outer membrane protein beta-barrel domain